MVVNLNPNPNDTTDIIVKRHMILHGDILFISFCIAVDDSYSLRTSNLILIASHPNVSCNAKLRPRCNIKKY